jgi:hypothetical protein
MSGPHELSLYVSLAEETPSDGGRGRTRVTKQVETTDRADLLPLVPVSADDK